MGIKIAEGNTFAIYSFQKTSVIVTQDGENGNYMCNQTLINCAMMEKKSGRWIIFVTRDQYWADRTSNNEIKVSWSRKHY